MCALSRGVITAVGDLHEVDAAQVIDCGGKPITPGFVDIHSLPTGSFPSPTTVS